MGVVGLDPEEGEDWVELFAHAAVPDVGAPLAGRVLHGQRRQDEHFRWLRLGGVLIRRRDGRIGLTLFSSSGCLCIC